MTQENKHQEYDKRPWRPESWVRYPNETKVIGGLTFEDPRNRAGIAATNLIYRLLALPKA